jgi:hypothetical protein
LTKRFFIILQALFWITIVPASARQGGDLGVCRVDVEGSSITMPVGPSIELGADGKEICFRFFTDVGEALEASQSAGEIVAQGGAGTSIADPVDIGAHIADENPMIPILRHYRGTAEGRFVHFILISRAEDRYVVEIAAGPAEGPVATRYYEYSTWVRLQLKKP